MLMPEDIVDICVMPVRKTKVSFCLLVALSSGEVRMYRESTLIHTFVLEKPVLALRFGQYGREDASLICVHGI